METKFWTCFQKLNWYSAIISSNENKLSFWKKFSIDENDNAIRKFVFIKGAIGDAAINCSISSVTLEWPRFAGCSRRILRATNSLLVRVPCGPRDHRLLTIRGLTRPPLEFNPVRSTVVERDRRKRERGGKTRVEKARRRLGSQQKRRRADNERETTSDETPRVSPVTLDRKSDTCAFLSEFPPCSFVSHALSTER